MEKTGKKGLKWWVWLLICLGLFGFAYVTWTDGFKDGYNKGYDYGYSENDAVYNGAIQEGINEILIDQTNRCIKHFCENIYKGNFITRDPVGMCDEEWSALASLNDCQLIIMGEQNG